MASRPVFEVTPRADGCVIDRLCDFQWHSGFATSQKQKNIKALHDAYKKKMPSNSILEISTKSLSALGVAHSAFNLKIKIGDQMFALESCYQSSKIFARGGPFRDLLESDPIEAKRDQRLQSSGIMKGFSGHIQRFSEESSEWPLLPKTMFYDWLFMRAVKDSGNISALSKFDAFSDIEFNPSKSFSCQARSTAIAVSLFREAPLNWLPHPEDMPSLYGSGEQKGLFPK